MFFQFFNRINIHRSTSQNVDFEGMRCQITWKMIDGDLGSGKGLSFCGISSSGVIVSPVGFETCSFFFIGLKELSLNIMM